MTRHPALLDGERGAHGVSFPDLPGIVAMGETVDETWRTPRKRFATMRPKRKGPAAPSDRRPRLNG